MTGSDLGPMTELVIFSEDRFPKAPKFAPNPKDQKVLESFSKRKAPQLPVTRTRRGTIVNTGESFGRKLPGWVKSLKPETEEGVTRVDLVGGGGRASHVQTFGDII